MSQPDDPDDLGTLGCVQCKQLGIKRCPSLTEEQALRYFLLVDPPTFTNPELLAGLARRQALVSKETKTKNQPQAKVEAS